MSLTIKNKEEYSRHSFSSLSSKQSGSPSHCQAPGMQRPLLHMKFPGILHSFVKLFQGKSCPSVTRTDNVYCIYICWNWSFLLVIPLEKKVPESLSTSSSQLMENSHPQKCQFSLDQLVEVANFSITPPPPCITSNPAFEDIDTALGGWILREKICGNHRPRMHV